MIPVSSIRFSKLEKKNNQYDIVNLTSNNKKIYLNLPTLFCPLGITKYINNNVEKYSLNLVLKREEQPEIYQFLENLDDWVTDNFIDNEKWLNKLNIPKGYSKRRLSKRGNKIINTQEKFPSYINLKLIFDKDGEFFCDIFKCINGQHIKLNNIEEIKDLLYKKVSVSSTIILSNVWIMDKKFGITLKPKKLVFYTN